MHRLEGDETTDLLAYILESYVSASVSAMSRSLGRDQDDVLNEIRERSALYVDNIPGPKPTWLVMSSAFLYTLGALEMTDREPGDECD